MRNVVLLTIDTLRRDALGCYGNAFGLTPFVDSLQTKLLKFTRAQATGPYTQASFPGILTSSFYLDYGRPQGLSPKRTLIAEPLKSAGIVTAAFHSNPYLSGHFGWNRGWHVFYDSMQDQVEDEAPFIRGDVINGKAASWLSAHTAGANSKPFFLWVHYMDVHEPYVPLRSYLDMVDRSISLSGDDMMALFRNVLLKRDVSDPGKVDLLRKLYWAKVRQVDDCVREFFGVLEGLRLVQDTAVIITSDHGDEFGDHGGVSHDDKLYRELVDIPLLIFDPDVQKARVCDLLVSNIDIAPTIVHLFGLNPIPAFQGHSLLPTEGFPPRGCFGEALANRGRREEDVERDVYFYREEDLKVIYRPAVDGWEMYDLQQDPREVRNIVDSSPKAAALKEKLKPRVRRWKQEALAAGGS